MAKQKMSYINLGPTLTGSVRLWQIRLFENVSDFRFPELVSVDFKHLP